MPIFSTVGGSRLLGRGPVSVVTGGTLTSDDTYFYRSFTGNGSLVVSGAPLACEYLVVAGGGSGGPSGGGGGGGVRSGSATLTANTYPAVVGAGGTLYVNGSPSSFNSLATSGGGYGGGNGLTAQSGGAGGGAGSTAGASLTGASGNAGAYTPAEGQKGGNTTSGSGGAGGGGGGPSSQGANEGQNIGTINQKYGANGGSGSFYSGFSSLFGSGGRFAGGGGGGAIATGFSGGTGGLGGGGRGGIGGNAPYTVGDNGLPGEENTGGGAGGSGYEGTGGGTNGGKGIVIVRYLKSAV